MGENYMQQDEYDTKFQTGDKDSKLLKAAFEQVSDIRKFEIELYYLFLGINSSCFCRILFHSCFRTHS